MIPNVFHYIFGLEKDFGGKPFSFVHFLAIKSAYEINKPDNIFFYYRYEPSGKWWEKCKEMVTLMQVEPPRSIFGNRLYHYAHQADILRLEILLKHGGIYLDMDVLCLKSFRPLLNYDFVMGKQGDRGLCNAVILSQPDSEFLKVWHDNYRSFASKGVDEFWDDHSVVLPLRLAEEHPSWIHVENEKTFFWPSYTHPEILWDNVETDFSESFCIHLWERMLWNKYLRYLSPKDIKKGNSNFAKLCKQFLL